MDGRTQYEGRLEISRDGAPWGTINGMVWTATHTAIACRTLGLSSSTAAPDKVDFGKGTGPVYTTIRYCLGMEWELMDCEHTLLEDGDSIGNHCCDVGIVCVPG